MLAVQRLGIIYPSDGVLDREFWEFAPPTATLHLTRVRLPDKPLTLDLTEGQVDDPDLDQAAEALRPIRPAAVAYACTAISFALGAAGDALIRDRIAARTGAPTVTTSSALLEACRALEVRRVAIAAPYVPEITGRLQAFLETAGIAVVEAVSLGLTTGIPDVPPVEVIALGRAADREEADALIISCTNFRSFEAIPVLERALAKPVISSTQATVWAACRRAGLRHPAGTGSLWEA